jgi:hypothetical protein
MEFLTNLTLAAALAAAPSDTRLEAASCPQVADYATWREAPDQQWDFRSPKLTVIGAVHSREAEHEQFARMATAFRETQPTIVFFEGPDRGVRATAEETIAAAGESGYVRFLAAKAGIPARSLDPSPGAQMKALLAEFPADQVLLFFVLREAARLRDRESLKGEALDQAVGGLLQRVAGMAAAGSIALPFTDIAGLRSAFQRYWPDRDWRSTDAAWFSPSADDRATGGIFTGAINRADSTNRDRHMAALLADAVGAEGRAFVAVGRNHVPMIAPRLRCLLGDR